MLGMQIRKTSVLSLTAQNFAAPRFLRPSEASEIHSALGHTRVVTSPPATVPQEERYAVVSRAQRLNGNRGVWVGVERTFCVGQALFWAKR